MVDRCVLAKRCFRCNNNIVQEAAEPRCSYMEIIYYNIIHGAVFTAPPGTYISYI